jgi:hypothetical protein
MYPSKRTNFVLKKKSETQSMDAQFYNTFIIIQIQSSF